MSETGRRSHGCARSRRDAGRRAVLVSCVLAVAVATWLYVQGEQIVDMRVTRGADYGISVTQVPDRVETVDSDGAGRTEDDYALFIHAGCPN